MYATKMKTVKLLTNMKSYLLEILKQFTFVLITVIIVLLSIVSRQLPGICIFIYWKRTLYILRTDVEIKFTSDDGIFFTLDAIFNTAMIWLREMLTFPPDRNLTGILS
jgi:hypothetical protein